jgi:hypothetical protein
MRWSKCWVVLGLWGLACQQREVPRDFRLELGEVIDSADPVTVTVRATNADGVSKILDGENPFVVEPAGLASITAKGSLRCERSGDGAVSLTLGPNTRKAPLKCRLVERVDASDAGRVDLNAGPFKPKVRVLGKGGVELDGVELVLSSKNSGVLFPRNNELVPKMVGTATIVARAGQVTQEFKVDVVRKLTPEALPMDQNRKINFSLEAGKYELRVDLPAPKQLSAEWRGAPYCDYKATAQNHVSTCVLRTKGGVVFDSPAYLIEHSTDISVQGVSISEVP